MGILRSLSGNTCAGVFLSWLRTSDQNGLVGKTKPFHNTFVPTIAPHNHGKRSQRSSNASSNYQKPALEEQVKDHHLDEEIESRLAELQDLENEFKVAERVAHTGVPTFEKMKQFLVKLTVLRAKEEEMRRFFIKQNMLLKQQHNEMRHETLHTREQLDFFVDGFTNLRHRHDALLETSTQMHAESEIAQEIFLSTSAHESHFAAIMTHTLNDQIAKNKALQKALDAADERIRAFEDKQSELAARISRLKQARGDAKKDAHCYKRQLRHCKQKMASMETENGDCGFFRDQSMNLRQSFASLLGYLRESVVRDTKSPKQVLSKEALKLIHQALNGSATAPPSSSPTPPIEQLLLRPHAVSSMDAIPAINSAVSPETPTNASEDALVPKVVKKTSEVKKDLDEAMRGVLLMGGSDGESARCATILGSKLRYLPIDMNETLLRFEEVERQQHLLELAQTKNGGSADVPTTPTISHLVPDIAGSERPLRIDSYQIEVKQYIEQEMQTRGARGFVMYNWEFTTHDANQLIRMGLPVDSIIELQTPPPALPHKSQTPGVSAVAASPTGKQTALPSRGGATPVSSPTKPNTSARTPSSSSSPSRAGSRQAAPKTPEAKKRSVETLSKHAQQKTPAVGKRLTATPAAEAALSSPEKKMPTVDRKGVFKGMLHMFHQIAPATFPEERVQCILDVLEQQKEKKAAAFVRWDETTQRANEMLSMFAEDVHMMLHVEQENRKPKKPHGTPASSSAEGGSSNEGNGPSKSVPAAAASSTARSKAKSPAKPAPTARGSGAAAAATSRRATSTATSRTAIAASVSPQRPDASPDKSKRVSVTMLPPESKETSTK